MKERGLASPGGPDDAHDLTIVDLQVESAKDVESPSHVTKGLPYVCRDDEGSRHGAVIT
jgi:hypothetical protein